MFVRGMSSSFYYQESDTMDGMEEQGDTEEAPCFQPPSAESSQVARYGTKRDPRTIPDLPLSHVGCPDCAGTGVYSDGAWACPCHCMEDE